MCLKDVIVGIVGKNYKPAHAASVLNSFWALSCLHLLKLSRVQGVESDTISMDPVC